MESASDIISPVEGKCWKMCPHAEAKFREANNLLSVFEVVKGQENVRKPRCDPGRCVKEFRRSAAGEKMNDPLHLRPASVLIQTVTYLLREIVPMQNVKFPLMYDFVFDRLRSVRQDVVIQQIQIANPGAVITIMEKCVRFYLCSLYVIKQMNISLIDRHIHRTHTKQCLQTLIGIYKTTGFSEENMANIATILSCYLMWNMDSTDELNEVLINFPKRIKFAEPLRTTLEMSYALIHNNFVRVYKSISKLKSHRHFLIIFAFLDNVEKYRENGISVLCRSHSSKTCSFPPEILIKWFLIEDFDDIRSLCKKHGMTINAQENVVFLKSNFVSAKLSYLQESYLVYPGSLYDIVQNILLP